MTSGLGALDVNGRNFRLLNPDVMTVESLDSAIDHLYEAETLHPITIYQSELSGRWDDIRIFASICFMLILNNPTSLDLYRSIRFEAVLTDISRIKEFLQSILLLLGVF